MGLRLLLLIFVGLAFQNSLMKNSMKSPIKGKFLFEFIVIKHKKGYFIDSEKSQIEEQYFIVTDNIFTKEEFQEYDWGLNEQKK